MIFYIAYLETRNFEFFAYAELPEMARELLQARWEKHVIETDAWLSWEDLKDDVCIEAIEMNSAHRR